VAKPVSTTASAEPTRFISISTNCLSVMLSDFALRAN
jgi:hypothetical protein